MEKTGLSLAAKLQDIRVAYIKQLPVQLQVIRDCLDTLTLKPARGAELEALHRVVHTLHGSSASFGLLQLAAAAAEGERLAKQALQTEEQPDLNWGSQMLAQLALMEREAASLQSEQVAVP